MNTVIDENMPTANQELVTVRGSNQETDAILSVIERVALDPNADIEKLERMLDMQERILNRNAVQAYSAAFSRMQADLPEISENGKIEVDKKLRSKYGLLEDINEAVKPILRQHGFSISFRIKQESTSIKITGILRHEQGHFEETDIVLPADNTGSKNAVQAIGSTVSYGKRYTMCALLNITTRGDDDDANSATKVVDHEQAVEIDLLISESGADKKRFLSLMGVEDVRRIRAADYLKAKNALRAKKQQTDKAAKEKQNVGA